MNSVIPQSPLVTVIIPVYNTAFYLRKCLDSVCGQTYRNLEIICVNDGSTDDSQAILEEYAARDERVRVLAQENSGQAVARNRALDVAQGEWVLMVDSDDYLAQNALERSLGIGILHPGCGAVFFEISPEGDVPEERKKGSAAYYMLKFEGMQTIGLPHMQRTDASMANKLIRRSIIEEKRLRFPEGMIYEDACFFFCLMVVLEQVFYLKELLYHYCMRDGSTMSTAYERNARVLDHLLIMERVAEFYRSHGLLPQKRHMLGYAFQYCCDFVERSAPAEKLGEVVDLEWKLAWQNGLFTCEMVYLPVVQKLRRCRQGRVERLFHRIYANRDSYGLGPLALWTVVHTEQGDVHYCLGRRVLERRRGR